MCVCGRQVLVQLDFADFPGMRSDSPYAVTVVQVQITILKINQMIQDVLRKIIVQTVEC